MPRVAPPPLAPRRWRCWRWRWAWRWRFGAPDQQLGAGRVLGGGARGQRRARPDAARPARGLRRRAVRRAWPPTPACSWPARCSRSTPTRARRRPPRGRARAGHRRAAVAPLAPGTAAAAGRRRGPAGLPRPRAAVPQRRRARAAGLADGAPLALQSGPAGSRCAWPAAWPPAAAAGGDGHRRRAGSGSACAGPAVAHRPAAGPGADGRALLRGWRCRRACRPVAPTTPSSACPTCRAPTASTSRCWRWWRCSSAPSWCSRWSRCRWRSARRPSRCWACWAHRARAPQLVLAECALLGAAGSALGLALGAGWRRRRCAAGRRPGRRLLPRHRAALQWRWRGRWLRGAGHAAALVGGWWPARQAERLAPAQALKGLGTRDARAPPAWPGAGAAGAGRALALCAAGAGLPLAAYAGGGGAAVRRRGAGAGGRARAAGAACRPPGALPLLALQRARFQRRTATAAVAGVVASLALSVALTVMVRASATASATWLDSVLPADLYARSAATSAAAEQAWLPPEFVQPPPPRCPAWRGCRPRATARCSWPRPAGGDADRAAAGATPKRCRCWTAAAAAPGEVACTSARRW
jgi:hypothetical protein